MALSEPAFLAGLGIFAGTAIVVTRTIAAVFTGRRSSRSELAQLREQVDQQAAALDDASASLADQAAQLAEVQDRLDFAERLLAQARERGALGDGSRE